MATQRNRTMQEVLRSYTADDQDAWDDNIWHAEVALNTSPQVSTGEPPHTLVFGRPMNVPTTILNKQLFRAPVVNEMLKSQEERIALYVSIL